MYIYKLLRAHIPMKFLHRHQVKPIDDESFTIYIVDYVCDISLSAILSELQGSSRCDFLYAAQKQTHTCTYSVSHTHILPYSRADMVLILNAFLVRIRFRAYNMHWLTRFSRNFKLKIHNATAHKNEKPELKIVAEKSLAFVYSVRLTVTRSEMVEIQN